MEFHPDSTSEPAPIFARSPGMRELVRQLELVGDLDSPVLVEGEPGSGKSLVARSLHRSSRRSAGPFVEVVLSELSPSLFESELFGHAPDAFAGALAGALGGGEGLVVAAAGGTLYLKDIAAMSLANQGSLLRFLRSGEVVPVGGGPPRKVDVRVVCASLGDLSREVERGFDRELYTHLRPFTLRVPPLRERREDLALLAQHYLSRSMVRHGKQVGAPSPEAWELLVAHRWEGNVLELEEEMERAVVLTPRGEPVSPEVLSPRLRGDPPARPAADP